MEESRTKTMQALETYIQSQKALLNATRNSIEDLYELRRGAVSCDEDQLNDVFNGLTSNSLRLSAQPAITPSISPHIDWALFRVSEPAPFRELASSLRHAHAERDQPSSLQESPLSDLQRLVKDARARIIDPVLASYSFLNDPSSDPEEEDAPDPEELRRAHEREKIRKLKKRKIASDAAVPVFASSRRPASSYGVFIRRDQEDESAEVDISLDGNAEEAASNSEPVSMDVDTPPTSVPPPASIAAGLPPPSGIKAEQHVRDKRKHVPPTRKAGPKVSGHVRCEPDDTADPPPVGGSSGPTNVKGKAISETYKQAWSVSEQHLLERLLEEIPDGEKNRWAKISKAMGGRRTPRQVSSRVQKYFEKLKRFGLDVDGGKGIP